ncbi:hypothetical protein SHIRM173S_08111 [Streptomyces hirsutus]
MPTATASPAGPGRRTRPPPPVRRVPTGGTLTRHIRIRPSEGNPPMPLETGLLEILACPACHSSLEEQDNELICTGQECGLAYPVRDGIPVLLVDEARRPA